MSGYFPFVVDAYFVVVLAGVAIVRYGFFITKSCLRCHVGVSSLIESSCGNLCFELKSCHKFNQIVPIRCSSS